jgi:beta-glucosidase
MGQHQSSRARRRRLIAGGSLMALGAAFTAIACGHLQSETGTPGDNGGGSSSGDVSGNGNGSGSGSGGGVGSSGAPGGGSNGAPGGGSSGAPGGGSSGSPGGGSSGAPGGGSSGSPGGGSSGAVVIVDASPPDAGKVACTGSSETLPYSVATPLAAVSMRGAQPVAITQAQVVSQAATIVQGMANNSTQLANQMRGSSVMLGGMANFSDTDRTPDDTIAGVKGFLFRDGPRGDNIVQAQYSGSLTSPTQVNYGAGYVTSFPVPAARGASWDLDLENRIGADMGDETLASGNTILLAPCINILRHPAWGRAEETYGEDSFLLGRVGSAFTQGVQQYIPACAKHFAANNIESQRETQNAQLDDQTLHEIYGRHFEMVVQEGGVACVMAAYNQVNGTKSTQNPALLTTMLKGVFGFKGFVLSDWWAMPPGQTIVAVAQMQQQIENMNAGLAINAGLDLEMPWSFDFSQLESAATPQQLQASAKAIIQQKIRFNILTPGVATQSLGLKQPASTLGANGIVAPQAHINDALQSAEEGIVLLKNDNNTLPIVRGSVHTIAVLGASVPWTLTPLKESGAVNFATDVRLGDLGSSRVASDPTKSVGPLAGIQAAAGSGIQVVTGSSATAASSADFVVVVAGLTPQDEGEEYTGAADRADANGNPNLALDGKAGTNLQNNLITAVAALKKPMVVVLEGGSAIDMPWLATVPSVVMAWYPGMVGGTALGKLLFGDVNFSGKLPITWPKTESDEPAFDPDPNGNGTTVMDYYLGYRYFDKNKITPLFAFGHGMSYSTFKYQYMQVPCSTVTKTSVVDVAVGITNTGTVAGSDVAFLFVSFPNTTARRSVKELKAFYRTPVIAPGSTVQVTLPLRVADLKYWNTTAAAWTVESGQVNVMVGPSSDNLPLTDSITVQ